MKKSIVIFFIALILTGVFAPLSFNVARAADPTDSIPSCGLGIWGDSSLAGCVGEIIYFLIYYPTYFLVYISASIFDWGIDYSIHRDSYTNSFLSEGWGIVRDISNIFFIFVLLWIAIGLMLGLHSVHPKKDIATVIVIALVINFSFFITRVVVDSGNILSYLFYNNITVQKAGCTPDPNNKNDHHCDIVSDETGSKSLSTKIASSVKITKLLGDSGIHDGVEISCDSATDNTCLNGKKVIEGSTYAGYFIFIVLVMSIFNIILAWTLFVIAFLFIGRVIAIWISIIFSPFAFISYTVPGLSKIPTIGNKAWWSDLLGAVFFAPIFLFFLYLILQFLNVGITNALKAQTTTVFGLIMTTTMPFLIVIGLILKAKNFSVKMAGETAGMFMKVGVAAGGLALGAATGGASLAMQRTVGASAAAKLKDEDLKDAASGKISADFRNRAGYKNLSDRQIQEKAERTLKTAQSRSSRSFDFRQTGIGQQMSNATGMNMGSFGRLATGNLAGGVEGAAARKAEKDRKFTELLGHNTQDYEAESDKLTDQKATLEKAQDIRGRLKDDIETAKNSGDDDQRIALEDQLSQVNNYIDTVKRGGNAGALNVYGNNNAWRETLGAKNFQATDPATGLATDISLQKREKNLENIKKARVKEYHSTQMKKSGYEYHGETRDELGNVKKLGHLDTSMRSNAREWGKDMWNDILKGAKQGAVAGGLLGLPGGLTAIPLSAIGGLAGGFKGLYTGGALPRMQELFSKAEAWATRNDLGGKGFIAPLNLKFQSDLSGTKILADASHIASDESHKIHTFNSKYKSPSKGFFSMFEGLAKPPSGGGGGDDHGGGGGGHH